MRFVVVTAALVVLVGGGLSGFVVAVGGQAVPGWVVDTSGSGLGPGLPFGSGRAVHAGRRLAGAPARRSVRRRRRFPLRNVRLFTVHGNRTIVVTGTAPADTLDGYGSVFESTLHTVTVGS